MTDVASASWSGTDVDVSAVERELAELWRRITAQSDGAAGARTSILNLIVYAKDENEADRISSELRQCTDRHPSRTIILVGDRHVSHSSVDARVTTYCVPSKSHSGLCYEELVFTGRGRAADHLSSMVIPFVIPGLPKYLWWPGQPAFGHRVFHQLLSVADQLIVDSAQFNTPADGIANLALLSRAKQGINDFNWARLRPWREIIAQFFDGPHWAPYAYGIRTISMEYASGTSDYRRAVVGTLLTLGWLAEELGWEPESTLDTPLSRDFSMSVLQGERVIDIDLRFRDHGPDVAGHLMAVEFVADPKGVPPARFKVVRSDDLRRADVSATIHEGTDIHRAVPLELETDADLLTHELEMAGHDHLYERILDTASRLAGRELFIPA